MDTGYSFGDSQRAARRLVRLAREFEAPSRAFLRDAARPGRALAIDLGCGPGLTTRLLAEASGARRTLGLDASQAFVAAARRAFAPPLEFAVHDLTRALPVADADLAYARMLLSHLPDVPAALRLWTRALRRGGRLLLDEVEWIRSDGEVFRRYLARIDGMLAARGQELRVGPRLEGAAAGAGRIVTSGVRVHRVPARAAATLFSLNLAELRETGALRADAGEDLDALARGLAAVREEGGPEITWGLRQLALEVE